MDWFRSGRIRPLRGSEHRRPRWPLLVFAAGVSLLIWAGWSATTAAAAAGLFTSCCEALESNMPYSP